MRLINTKTYALERFRKPPQEYAILSHTWGDHEINLQKFVQWVAAQKKASKEEKKGGLTDEEEKQGLEKILQFCKLARLDGFQYAWIDTCCIDKTNPTELSESLNSMYQWYQDSSVCYTYLVDVDEKKDPLAAGSEFRNSRWFTRGWTLQELLAPLTVVFYGKNWIEIGTKATLSKAITDVTGIRDVVLLVNFPEEISLGERLSWAAGRETSRIEDRAYSLLGLLQINMPAHYGEGKQAFIRLQEELIKSSDDQTIFAWKGPEGSANGLLADSPDAFRGIKGKPVKILKDRVMPFTMTNGGLAFRTMYT
ncbi:heterokaryon incompatibility protein-domain-containing protein [Kalaharituber pfeilii]|nr:heterokaryon incompatibility protein-domain-containing protein [Kalaharituber pfeilii]